MHIYHLPEQQSFACALLESPLSEPAGGLENLLLFQLTGRSGLTLAGGGCRLSTSDLAVVPSGVPFALTPEAGSVVGVIRLHQRCLAWAESAPVTPLCLCSAGPEVPVSPEVIGRLRSAGHALLRETHSGAAARLSPAAAAAYYSMVDTLLHQCAQPFPQADPQDRDAEIRRLILQNYASPYTLGQLAAALHLSENYLSRYIRQKMGTTFLGLLTQMRLRRAREQLEDPACSLTRVALDSGFTSLYALNKAFRSAYGCLPAEYRKRSLAQRPEAPLPPQPVPPGDPLPGNTAPTVHTVRISALQGLPLRKSWSSTLNIGTARELLRYDLRAQVLQLKKALGFTHVRLWDLYDPEMLLLPERGRRDTSYVVLDRILDFLTDNGLSPHIELGFKPVLLLRSTSSRIVVKEREPAFRSNDEYAAFLSGLLQHCVDRYGSKTVSLWRLEQWDDPRFDLLGGSDRFFRCFETVKRTADAVCPGILVGGGSFSVDSVGDALADCLTRWAARGSRPDFISFYVYPYTSSSMDSQRSGGDRLFDNHFVCRQVRLARRYLAQTALKDVPLYVTEWNLTVSNRNNLNDSCFKGAFLVRSMLEAGDDAEVFAYWLGSDIFGEHFDTAGPLSGGSGLITRDGIAKPAMIAMQFLNQLGPKVLFRDENCIVTAEEGGELILLCHNCAALSLRYFSTPEDQIPLNRQADCFEHTAPLTLRVRLDGLSGRFLKKSLRLNSGSGSVQDEWLRMGAESDLSPADVEYLSRICTPQIHIEKITANDGLEISAQLEPNEVQLIRLSLVKR